MSNRCTHRDRIRAVSLSADGCEECLETGDSSVPRRHAGRNSEDY